MRGVLRVLPLLLVWPGVQSASFPVFPSLLPAPTPLEEELSPVAPTGDAVFTQQNNTELRAQVGTTAVLHCPAHNIGEDTVSWIRRRDFHLLTVGSQAYSSDDRFQVRYVKLQQDWQLHIRYVQARDDGVYECQVTSHPPVSLFSTLHVLEATSEILGGPEKYVTVGSSLRLVCVLRDNTQPPTYVFWYHHHHMINFHATRQVRVENSEGLSVLFLNNVRPADSGNYTCAPSNTRPAHIIIHVLKGGETPAAIHSGDRRSSTPPPLLPLALSLLLCLASTYFSRAASSTTTSPVRKADDTPVTAPTDQSVTLPHQSRHGHHPRPRQSSQRRTAAPLGGPRDVCPRIQRPDRMERCGQRLAIGVDRRVRSDGWWVAGES